MCVFVWIGGWMRVRVWLVRWMDTIIIAVQYAYGRWARAHAQDHAHAVGVCRGKNSHLDFFLLIYIIIIVIFLNILFYFVSFFFSEHIRNFKTKHRISCMSSALWTGEGFINRVIDNRVGRWDFRSFGSLLLSSPKFRLGWFIFSINFKLSVKITM